MHHGLQALEAPFTSDEIHGIIKDLPSNKSHVPDGFNTNVMKDFYDLCSQFHEGSFCIQIINASLITLTPKVDGLPV